eukprot:scaffold1263_cov170-Ochromonas_danica.AAC.6
MWIVVVAVERHYFASICADSRGSRVWREVNAGGICIVYMNRLLPLCVMWVETWGCGMGNLGNSVLQGER